MRVTLKFDAGFFGDVEIETDTDHGSPERVWFGAREVTDNGPFVDVIMNMIGPDKFMDRLNRAESEKIEGDGMAMAKNKSERELCDREAGFSHV